MTTLSYRILIKLASRLVYSQNHDTNAIGTARNEQYTVSENVSDKDSFRETGPNGNCWRLDSARYMDC